jgi:hypothetical protein
MNALLKKRVRKSVPQQFSDWPAPTAAECEEVTERLARLHGRVRRPKQVVARPETDSCGEVPTILDALVRTILSQNTTNKNSRGAMRSFLTRFEGDYEKVRVAKTLLRPSLPSAGRCHWSTCAPWAMPKLKRR